MNSMLAYIDPGMGLLAWQAVVAAVLGLVFYLRKTRSFLVALVTRPFQKNRAPQPVPLKVGTNLDKTGR